MCMKSLEWENNAAHTHQERVLFLKPHFRNIE